MTNKLTARQGKRKDFENIHIAAHESPIIPYAFFNLLSPIQSNCANKMNVSNILMTVTSIKTVKQSATQNMDIPDDCLASAVKRKKGRP